MRCTSLSGVDLIKTFEGLELTAYKPHADDVWTIGYGTTRINGRPVERGTEITRHQAQLYLISDLRYFEKSVNALVEVPISQNQFDALVSFAYNVGVGNLKKSTLLKKLNKGDYLGASKEFPKWKYSAGKVLKGLVKRRKAEAEIFSLDIVKNPAKIKKDKIEVCEEVDCDVCEESQCQTKSECSD